MTIDEYFGDWLKVIDKKELLSITKKINNLYQTQSIMPDYKDIFRAFHLCPYNDLKVVFIGQDPYPQKGVATGILFGNRPGKKEVSPSLEIIKEACIDYTIPHPPIQFDNTLESWAKQGILMINSALTTIEDKPGCHFTIWKPFMSKLLTNLGYMHFGLIYVLFGNQAQLLKPYINKEYNDIIEEKHPAYYARTKTRMSSDLFKFINRVLMGRNGECIKWFNTYGE